jgi:hypothetical protein
MAGTSTIAARDTAAEKCAGMSLPEWNLLPSSHERQSVRVVTIKHPPAAIEGVPSDNSIVGKIFDVAPHLAILMIAAGWVRSESRSNVRRRETLPGGFNRRQRSDRRSAAA